jgi:hypothetical protein
MTKDECIAMQVLSIAYRNIHENIRTRIASTKK